MRDSGHVIVVEGYMDVVALAQHGVQAVATLGTAHADHVDKLLRHRRGGVLLRRRRGRPARRRGAGSGLPLPPTELRFLFLPAEHDPDSFVREHGPEGFEGEVEGACRCRSSSSRCPSTTAT